MIPQQLSFRGELASQPFESRIFKYYLALVFFLVTLFPITALSKAKTLTVEGIYVKVFPYVELSDYYNQKLLQMEGKKKTSIDKFPGMGDVKSYETFIVLTDEISAEIPEQKFKYNSDDLDLIIQFPKSALDTFYKRIGFHYINYRKISQIMTSAIRLSPYYESKNGEFIYRIVYMKVKIERSDNYINYAKNGIHNINLYNELWVIKKIISYDPYVDIPWLKKWAPFNRYKEEPALEESELPETEGIIDPLSND